MGSNLDVARTNKTPKTIEVRIKEANDFFDQFYKSKKLENSKEHKDRVNGVLASLILRGTYELTKEELSFGAMTGWRNASRCIGRIQWSKLHVS